MAGLVATVIALGLAVPAVAHTSRSRTLRPETGTVIGAVLDDAGHRVGGATVIAIPVNRATCSRVSTVTNDLGEFELDGITPGEYWFIGIHGDHPIGMTRAMPVTEKLEVTIFLDGADITA